jgi:hypothetical protein
LDLRAIGVGDCICHRVCLVWSSVFSLV